MQKSGRYFTSIPLNFSPQPHLEATQHKNAVATGGQNQSLRGAPPWRNQSQLKNTDKKVNDQLSCDVHNKGLVDIGVREGTIQPINSYASLLMY